MNEYNEIRRAFKESFPKGWITFQQGALGKGTTFVRFGMLPTDQIPANIFQNDPLYNMFQFELLEDGTFTAEYCNGGLSVNPPKGSYLAMEHVKTRFRKRKLASYEKLVNAFTNYFRAVRLVVEDNVDNIYGGSRYNFKEIL